MATIKPFHESIIDAAGRCKNLEVLKELATLTIDTEFSEVHNADVFTAFRTKGMELEWKLDLTWILFQERLMKQ